MPRSWPSCLPARWGLFLSAFVSVLDAVLHFGMWAGEREQVGLLPPAGQLGQAPCCLPGGSVHRTVLRNTAAAIGLCSQQKSHLGFEQPPTPAPPHLLMLPTAFAPQEAAAAVGQCHQAWPQTIALELHLTVAPPLLQVLPGGRVIWRSAAVRPPYVKLIEQAGFDVKCLQLADHGFMDRVNMYSSFYVAVRQ